MCIMSTNIVLCVFSIRGEEEMADSDYLLVKGEDVGRGRWGGSGNRFGDID